jgi:hypothetical protein
LLLMLLLPWTNLRCNDRVTRGWWWWCWWCGPGLRHCPCSR